MSAIEHTKQPGQQLPSEISAEGSETLSNAEKDALRLEGADLLGRELRHLLNNDLAIIVGLADMISGDTSLSSHLRESAQAVVAAATSASKTLESTAKLRQLAIKDTPVGKSLDLQRSTVSESTSS